MKIQMRTNPNRGPAGRFLAKLVLSSIPILGTASCHSSGGFGLIGWGGGGGGLNRLSDRRTESLRQSDILPDSIDPRYKLHLAVARNDLAAVKRLVEAGYRVNLPIEAGYADGSYGRDLIPLTLARLLPTHQIEDYLRSQGAKDYRSGPVYRLTDIECLLNPTPFQEAIFNQDLCEADRLVKAGYRTDFEISFRTIHSAPTWSNLFELVQTFPTTDAEKFLNGLQTRGAQPASRLASKQRKPV